MALSATQTATIASLIEAEAHRQGPLLPILHAVQQALGYIPADAVPTIAKALNLSRAEVHGVISFYHEFRTEPGGQTTVQVCRAEACQARGSRALEAHAKQALGLEYGETSADGSVTLEAVYCLGNCACGPSLRIADEVYARVDAGRFDQLLSRITGRGDAV
ncbi:MAG: formate dehydrogenase subunit gamma [Gammaproteobacteria bacterium]|uniref:formate dehydrogenase subunit gamma n=1 Tax=Pseudomaricurvus alcaniphilus TaxID=1166482 RepID=UPI00140A2885|nr:formate dehydrogenase subunit gamma [Pseudomaricurvus alcaniphilus]MBR9913145.1 formate dehydrogenase subunit gamma [Gammaproteobacteria bacterium]NHN37561.1 formate dehydrogenase subunit gamma [Pseudomaricurvus alcaniphilus]